jgi:hypothetical protein
VLLAAPQLTAEALVGAAAAASAAGHRELAVVLLKAQLAQGNPIAVAAAELREPSLGLEVLGLWEAAEGAARQEQAR